MCVVVVILIASLAGRCFVAWGLFEAGNSSFSPLQERSFWRSEGGGKYTFGFQAVHGGNDYLLSIWRSADPSKTPIWWPVAHRYVNFDPTVKVSSIFNFTSKGTTELQSSINGSLLWRITDYEASSYAEFQDSGNLVFFYNSSSIAWQTFQGPRDSLMLAGLNITNVVNKLFLLQSRRNQSSYLTGPFHLKTDRDQNMELHRRDQWSKNDFIYLQGQITFKGGFSISKDGRTYKDNTFIELKKLTLDYDGNLWIYQWESSTNSWIRVWKLLTNQCMVGSPCGPFGICEDVDADGKPNCSCPTGYQFIVAEDPSQGCESSIRFNASCGANFTDYTVTMVAVPNTDYNYFDLEYQTGVDIEECKRLCLNMCQDCMASVYIENGSKCYVKGNSTLGYLMNGYVTDKNTLLMKVVTLNPQAESQALEAKKHQGLMIGVGVAAALLVIVGFSAWLLWRRKKDGMSLSALLRPRGHKHIAGDIAGSLRKYRYDELVVATRNFSEKLGEGGFGTVFKGWVNRGFNTEEQIGNNNANDNIEQLLAVAVKVLKSSGIKKVDGESNSQFKAEINTLGKIHHVNLVSLLGYSYSSTGAEMERLLVYECMERGSLDKYLSTTSAQHLEPKLAWSTRFSIALGAARGIAYLHHDCRPPILHCDIKPHNILLDAHFTAKVADFGFARRFHLHDSHITMSAVRGTRGYLAPEWLTSDELTFKVDVYSFGMVLLELVRGFKTADEFQMPLVEWAIQCVSQGGVMEFSQHPDDVRVGDTSIDDVHSPHQDHQNSEINEKLRLLKVGMWCIQHKPSMRPPMFRVVQLIEGAITMEDPPNPIRSFPPCLSSSSSKSNHYSYSSFSAR